MNKDESAVFDRFHEAAQRFADPAVGGPLPDGAGFRKSHGETTDRPGSGVEVQMNDGVLPLEELRIVEGSAFVAAPLGGMTLAQLGADVIRFDNIGGI